MASTRIRKAFKYPADNSDEDDEPTELDEEGRRSYGRYQSTADLRRRAREAHCEAAA